jgi:hypothetical protein
VKKLDQLEKRPRPRIKANVPPVASQRGLVYEPLPVLDQSVKANKGQKNDYKAVENPYEIDREEERRKIEDCLKRILLTKRLRK